MALTTLADIVEEARTVVAAIATSGDGARLFKEHTTNTPFETSPIAGADGFEVVTREEHQTQGFGVAGAREWMCDLVIKLGHSSYVPDNTRETNRQDDIERLTDLMEANAWPDGTSLILHTGTSTNKSDPSWWLTELTFRCVWVGSVRTS